VGLLVAGSRGSFMALALVVQPTLMPPTVPLVTKA
jgi:hypothetical protein